MSLHVPKTESNIIERALPFIKRLRSSPPTRGREPVGHTWQRLYQSYLLCSCMLIIVKFTTRTCQLTGFLQQWLLFVIREVLAQHKKGCLLSLLCWRQETYI